MTTRHRMRARAREESGHTLVELLVTMVLSVLMLGVVLLIGDLFLANSTANSKLTQAEDDSRRVMSQMVRTVRDAPQPASGTGPILPPRTAA